MPSSSNLPRNWPILSHIIFPGNVHLFGHISPHVWVGKLISWTHNILALGYPGTKRALELLSGRYWWPTTSMDSNAFITSCLTCAWAKVSRNFPAGKLMPLSTPHRPWSHIALDCITNLLELGGYTVILVILDWFSHLMKLTSLSALLIAFEEETPVQQCCQVLWYSWGYGQQWGQYQEFISRMLLWKNCGWWWASCLVTTCNSMGKCSECINKLGDICTNAAHKIKMTEHGFSHGSNTHSIHWATTPCSSHIFSLCWVTNL